MIKEESIPRNQFVILNRQSVRGLLDSKKSIDNNVIVFNTDEYSLKDLEPIREKLNNNQKITNKLLELWLQLLDHGIGGIPTEEEVEIFKKISDILPKKLRDEKLDELKLGVGNENRVN